MIKANFLGDEVPKNPNITHESESELEPDIELELNLTLNNCNFGFKPMTLNESKIW